MLHTRLLPYHNPQPQPQPLPLSLSLYEDRAKDRRTGEIVALKKIRLILAPNEDQAQQTKPTSVADLPHDGLPLSHFREIQLLQSLQHPNVVSIKEIAVGRQLSSIFTVMEYCEHDIANLLDSMKKPFSPSEIKCLLWQLLKGVEYLHQHFIIHR